jgi:hypothetical protein
MLNYGGEMNSVEKLGKTKYRTKKREREKRMLKMD